MVTESRLISCIVDTDILIDHLRGRQYAIRLLERWNESGLLAISVITQLEIYQGVRPDEVVRTDALLESPVSLDVDVSLARLTGTLIGEFRRRGITVSMADAIIGATALQRRVPLLTNNVRDYPFPELTLVEGYSAEQ